MKVRVSEEVWTKEITRTGMSGMVEVDKLLNVKFAHPNFYIYRR